MVENRICIYPPLRRKRNELETYIASVNEGKELQYISLLKKVLSNFISSIAKILKRWSRLKGSQVPRPNLQYTEVVYNPTVHRRLGNLRYTVGWVREPD